MTNIILYAIIYMLKEIRVTDGWKHPSGIERRLDSVSKKDSGFPLATKTQKAVNDNEVLQSFRVGRRFSVL